MFLGAYGLSSVVYRALSCAKNNWESDAADNEAENSSARILRVEKEEDADILFVEAAHASEK